GLLADQHQRCATRPFADDHLRCLFPQVAATAGFRRIAVAAGREGSGDHEGGVAPGGRPARRSAARPPDQGLTRMGVSCGAADARVITPTLNTKLITSRTSA